MARTVPELRDRCPGSIEDADRAVAGVAVLAVDEREELLIRRQEADTRGLAVRVQPARAALGHQIERRAIRRRSSDDREAGAERGVGGVRGSEIGRDAIRAAFERLRAPHAELAPFVVVPPPDLVALRRTLRDASLDPGGEVECVHVEGALVIGCVHEPLRRITGPLREREPRRAVAPLPGSAGHSVLATRFTHAPSVSV